VRPHNGPNGKTIENGPGTTILMRLRVTLYLHFSYALIYSGPTRFRF